MEKEKPPAENILQDIQSAKEKSKKFSETKEELVEVRKDLKEKLLSLKSDISEKKHDDIVRAIDRSDYGKARELLINAAKEVQFQFTNEDKKKFAKAFKKTLNELQENIELIRNELMLISECDINRKQLIDYLYGAHSNLNKGDIQAVFEAIDDFEKTGVNLKILARVLNVFNRDLNITTAENILKYIKEHSGGES